MQQVRPACAHFVAKMDLGCFCNQPNPQCLLLTTPMHANVLVGLACKLRGSQFEHEQAWMACWGAGSGLMPQKKNPDALELMRGTKPHPKF